MSKQTNIVILGESNYRNLESRFAHATGQTGKDLYFKFFSVNNGRYCEALSAIQDFLEKESSVCVYVITNRETSKDFLRLVRKRVNRKMFHLQKLLENISVQHIDISAGITEDFFKANVPDKKPVTKRRAA